MKRIILLTLFLTIALCSSPVSTLNAGKIAEWQMNQSAEVMTRDYTSDFSVGVDGFATVRGTATGSLGVINGRTDPLKLVANTNNSSHYVNKVLTTIGEYYHLNTEIYVPSGQTTADGFAIFDGGVLVYDGASLNGSWAPVSVDYLATTIGLRFYLKDGTSFTFAGVGAGDDSLYVYGIMLNQVSTPDLVSSNHATMNYTAYDTSMYGGLNKCLLFDGADSFIDAGTDFIGAGNVTVSAWIYTEGWGEGLEGMILFNGGSSFQFYASTSKDNIRVRSDGSTVAESATNSIVLNTWYNVLVTRTSATTSNTNIYINGTLSGTANQNSGTPAVAGTNLIIGNYDTGARTFDGKLDDIGIWNRILTTTEIELLYDKGPE